jgi:hypothetical protein
MDAMFFTVCMAKRSARGFEVKDARSAPPPAAAVRAVLEFEILSRIVAAKQSMKVLR